MSNKNNNNQGHQSSVARYQHPLVRQHDNGLAELSDRFISKALSIKTEWSVEKDYDGNPIGSPACTAEIVLSDGSSVKVSLVKTDPDAVMVETETVNVHEHERQLQLIVEKFGKGVSNLEHAWVSVQDSQDAPVGCALPEVLLKFADTKSQIEELKSKPLTIGPRRHGR